MIPSGYSTDPTKLADFCRTMASKHDVSGQLLFLDTLIAEFTRAREEAASVPRSRTT